MARTEGLSVLVFAKEKPFWEHSLLHIKKHTNNIVVFTGEVADEFPAKAYGLCPDLTISYVSPWIIPSEVLSATKRWSINFHPGPPEYPGIGCTNFALYNEENEFGVTAHAMAEKVDTGRIIAVERFPIASDETVYSLSQKCYEHIHGLFVMIIDQIAQEGSLSFCGEEWSRKPYTRKELNDLCEIRPGMDTDEIDRRVRATAYPGMPGAYVKLGKHIFECNP